VNPLAFATVCVWLLWLIEPVAFVTVRLTGYEPAAANRYAAFCVVLVTEPSIVQFHVVGVPVLVSVKVTTCPGVDGFADWVKSAVIGKLAV
jgi:hypothetical protein